MAAKRNARRTRKSINRENAPKISLDPKSILSSAALGRTIRRSDQPLAHYNAGITAPSTNGSGVFVLTQPLPYAPAASDTFTVYPGCDKSQRTCQLKFNNIANFAGFPYVPAPETAA
jgi:hypothetical protein